MKVIKRPINMLISYYYFSKANVGKMIDEIFDEKPYVFADSGAYSAWAKGENIDVRGYAEWLHRWKDWFHVYANLDVKASMKEGLENQSYLESEGLEPIPVYHTGEPWSVFVDMCKEYDYIGLGGIAGHHNTTSPEMLRWFVKCFKMAREHNVKLHGFGITKWRILKTFPWHSVDSTSWGSGFRFGSVPLFDHRRGNLITLPLGEPKGVYKWANLIRDYGFEPEQIADRTKNTRLVNATMGALSFMNAEQYLWKYWSSDNRNPKVFLADSASSFANFDYAQQGLRIYLAESKTDMGDLSLVKEGLDDYSG